MAPGVRAVAALVAAAGIAIAAPRDAAHAGSVPSSSLVVRDADGAALSRVPLVAETFAVSYRNSIYRTLAEERYRVLPGGRYRLVEIAADQLAVIEEYYAVPGPPRPASEGDRRAFVAPPDPARPLVLQRLSIAATDLGERTLHVPGEAPVALWRLVDDERPFVTLEIEDVR